MWYVFGSRPEGHKKEGFHPGVQLYTKLSSPKVPTSHRVCLTQLHPKQGGHLPIRVNLHCTKEEEQCLSTNKATLYKYVQSLLLLLLKANIQNKI